MSEFSRGENRHGGAIGLSLGYFDGVHLGHAKLIGEAKKSCPLSVVRIFESLPKADVMLTTLDEKLALFDSLGVDCVIIDDFGALRDMSGREFFGSCVASLSPASVVCGYNYRFGKGAAYTTDDMKKYSAEMGISCTVVPEFILGGESVSSSKIRALLADGDVERANALLGRMYSVTDRVCHGKELGRTIGFPTINQRPPKSKALPKDGIYSCTAEFFADGEKIVRGGVCNIGSRPTVNSDENDITLETYIFDYEGDLYSKEVKISFAERLRGEVRFDSVERLREAIASDALHARESLGKHLYIYNNK